MLDREASIRAQLSFLFGDLRDNECVELCALLGQNGVGPWEGYASKSKGGGCAVVAGWYTRLESLIEQAVLLDHGWKGRGGEERFVDQGLYVCMNPANSDLAALANNRMKAGGRTQKKYVTRRVAVLIDVDPERVSGISSTDEEKAAAWTKLREVRQYLENEKDFPLPLVADSGNGFHALYPLNAEANDEDVVSSFLKVLGAKFSGRAGNVLVKVDMSVGDPSRLVKLYGTVARKGDNMEARPHRRSGVLSVPEYVEADGIWRTINCLTLDTLKDIVEDAVLDGDVSAPATAAPLANNASSGANRLDVPAYLEHYGKEVVKVKPLEGGGILYVLDECVFDPDHAGGEAGIGQTTEGKLFYQCFHDSCKSQQGPGGGRNWKDARLLISGSDSLRQFYGGEEGFKPVPVGGSEGVTPVTPSPSRPSATGDLVFPNVTKKGAPKGTIENIETLIAHYGIEVKFNEMLKNIEYRVDRGRWEEADNRNDLVVNHVKNLCVHYGMPFGQVGNWLENIAADRSYHPVVQWINSRDWDGVPRLEDLASTIQVAEGQERIWRVYLKKWLVMGVAALYMPNFHCRGVLTFMGGQGVGKTSWLRNLVPTELGAFGEGLHLDPKNKDAMLAVLRHWIVELGEVEGIFKKADVSMLKAFITAPVDVLRKPYGKETVPWRRRTILAATVNEAQFLVDVTGNTRWWCVEAEHIDWRRVRDEIDMQQVWAEAKALLEIGETWFLNEEETAEMNFVNNDFRQVDTIDEKVETYFDWDRPLSVYMRVSDVLDAIGCVKTSRSDETRLANLLQNKVGKSKRMSVNGVRGKFYTLPPLRETLNRFTSVSEEETEQKLIN